MKEDENTLFKAMSRFSDIAQAAALTANEVALFYTLLHRWNVARRPAVIEQWAESTQREAGLSSVKVLRETRNKLEQRGVIFVEKRSPRSVPRYSLAALFGEPSPFIVSLRDSITDTKRTLKRTLNGHYNGHSYQEKEKEKHKEKESNEKTVTSALQKALPETTSSNGVCVIPPKIPTLDEARRFAQSDISMIPPDAVEAWHDDRTSIGWEKPKGQTVVPIRDWRADLRGFSRLWKDNRQSRPEERRKQAQQTSAL